MWFVCLLLLPTACRDTHGETFKDIGATDFARGIYARSRWRRADINPINPATFN